MNRSVHQCPRMFHFRAHEGGGDHGGGDESSHEFVLNWPFTIKRLANSIEMQANTGASEDFLGLRDAIKDNFWNVAQLDEARLFFRSHDNATPSVFNFSAQQVYRHKAVAGQSQTRQTYLGSFPTYGLRELRGEERDAA